MRIGIACASGSAKGVFVHGVLAGLETRGFRAEMYAASSSTSIPAAFAAIHDMDSLQDIEYWKRVRAEYVEAGSDASRAVKLGISAVLPTLGGRLFTDRASRFAVAVSAVVTREAAALTQGEGARRLGQQLVISIRRRDRSWADANLSARLLDTRAADPAHRLTPANLADALYATTRMLHAWKEPAWIDGEPYVDASYTSMCPARELVRLGMEEVVAISPECGTVYTDFFQSAEMPASLGGVRIHVIQPQVNLAEIGVDYLKATDDGSLTAFRLGQEAAVQFLRAFPNGGTPPPR